MKIGIIAHIKHPIREPFAGGLEAFTYDIALLLKSRGHIVTLFAHPESAVELDVTPIASFQTDQKQATKHVYDSLSEEYIAEHHSYMDCLQHIDNCNYDVIFNNSLHYVPVTLSGMIKTPMLTVLHTPPFFELSNAIAAQRSRGGGDYCTVSYKNAALWNDLIPDCPVISNGINVDIWRPTVRPLDNYAFWYGRLVADKGAHIAIDAARIAGIPIRLAGQAIDLAYFNEQIVPRLGSGVEYLGHLSRPALVDELSNAKVCLVTPCWSEPFGLVVAESLACGTPVAALPLGAIPELLSDATGILATNCDAASLAKALLDACALDRTECRDRALSLWNIESMVTQYENVLGSLVCKTICNND